MDKPKSSLRPIADMVNGENYPYYTEHVLPAGIKALIDENLDTTSLTIGDRIVVGRSGMIEAIARYVHEVRLEELHWALERCNQNGAMNTKAHIRCRIEALEKEGPASAPAVKPSPRPEPASDLASKLVVRPPV